MRIAILSTCSAAHAFIINQVHRRFPVVLLMQPVPGPGRSESRLARLRKATPRKLWNLVESRFYSRHLAHLDARLRQSLGDCDLDPSIERVEQIPRSRINSASSVDLLKQSQPDVLIVSGGPLLSREIFEQPRLGSVNVHFGIAPQYRGEHTLFWPLVHRNYECLGVTVHYIDSGIDTGEILAHGYPALELGVDEAELWACCSRLAAEILCDFLEASQQGKVTGLRQTAKGKNYSWSSRRLRHDLMYSFRRRLHRDTIPTRQQSIVRYF